MVEMMVQQQPQQKLVNQKVKISVDEILEKYDCPICMCKLTEPHIVKCGHTFCKDCILECVNRQKECPACRAPCSKDDIFRNYSLEVLLQKLTEERDSEQQRYFNDLANNAIHQLDMKREGSQNNDYIQREKQDQSPIETVFMMNLRESLLSYQEYFEGLLKEKEVLIKKVKHSHSQNLLNARLADNQMEQSSINLQIDQQLKEIEQKFSNAIDSLVQSYDEHMRNIIPKPKIQNYKRICENCKDGCHQGHNLLPHLLNHRPTWACCYCMKKDLCKIANKKNKSYYQ